MTERERPTGEQPVVTPSVTTAPARGRLARIPSHVGRARTSTLVLSLLFLAIGALYLNIRPDAPATVTTPADSGTVQPVPTTTAPTPVPTTEATTEPTTTAPGTTTEEESTTTAESTPTEETPETTTPEETAETSPPTEPSPTSRATSPTGVSPPG